MTCENCGGIYYVNKSGSDYGRKDDGYSDAYNTYLKDLARWEAAYYSFGKPAKTSDEFRIKTSILANGAFQYADENGHGQLKMFQSSQGTPMFYASNRDMVQLVYGRAELDKGVTRYLDRNPVNE